MIQQKRIRICILQQCLIAMAIVVVFIGIVMANDGIADGANHNVDHNVDTIIHQEETMNIASDIPPSDNQNSHVPLQPDDIPIGETKSPVREHEEVVGTSADFTDPRHPRSRDESFPLTQEKHNQQHPNDMHLKDEETLEAAPTNDTIEPQQPEEKRTETRASLVETSLDDDKSRLGHEFHADKQSPQETKQFHTMEDMERREEVINSQTVLDVESGQDSSYATESLEPEQLPEPGELKRDPELVKSNSEHLKTDNEDAAIHSEMQVQEGLKTETLLPEVEQIIQRLVVDDESYSDVDFIQSASSQSEDSQMLLNKSPPLILSSIDDNDLTSTGSTPDHVPDSLGDFPTTENRNSPLDHQGLSSQAKLEEKLEATDSEESRDEKLSIRHATEPLDDQPKYPGSGKEAPKKGSLAEFFQQASEKDKERKLRVLEAESLNIVKEDAESIISDAQENSSTDQTEHAKSPTALGEDELMKLLDGRYPQHFCSFWGNSQNKERKHADLSILLQLFYDLAFGEENLHAFKSPQEAAFESAGDIFKHSSLNLKEEVIKSFHPDTKHPAEARNDAPGPSSSKDFIVTVDDIDKLFLDVTSPYDSETGANGSSVHDVFVTSAIEMFMDKSKLGLRVLKREIIQLYNAIVALMKNENGEFAPLRKLRDANGELILLLPFLNEGDDFAPFHRLRNKQGEINLLSHLKNENGQLSAPSKEQLVAFGKNMKSASIKFYHKVEDFIKHFLEGEDVEIELDDFDFEFLSQDNPKEALS